METIGKETGDHCKLMGNHWNVVGGHRGNSIQIPGSALSTMKFRKTHGACCSVWNISKSLELQRKVIGHWIFMEKPLENVAFRLCMLVLW